jgi:AcrR family transcriptional regulator
MKKKETTAPAAIGNDAPPVKLAIKRIRSDKIENTRRALFEAAVEIISEEGYANASVIKITCRANVAHGTFYNYFETRQDLFDQLLPALGDRLLVHISAHLDESLTGISRERRRIEAYFGFCKKTPGFLRVLNEAEVFAPKAFRKHIKLIYEGYLRSLERSLQRGDITGFSVDELGAVVFMLMGIRSYITMLYQHGYIQRSKMNIEQLIDAYSKFVDRALFK